MKRRILNAAAPIRICDIGGWTDTWFAGHGTIFNIAVYPYVEVQIHIVDAADLESRVVINLENFNERFSVDPKQIAYDKHPLIEAALDVMAIPDDVSFEVNIFSTAPPGASTGTSAAVSVALIGALDSLTSGRLSPHEVAMLAHSLETEKLGLQCGIQDQLCSAYGGVNYIQMHSFPHASVSPVLVPNSIWWELEQRLAVVYIGTPHSSNEVHKKVIAGMGKDPAATPGWKASVGLHPRQRTRSIRAILPSSVTPWTATLMCSEQCTKTSCVRNSRKSSPFPGSSGSSGARSMAPEATAGR